MSLPRLIRRPGFLGGILFLAAMGLAAAIGWQAMRAAASHRAAAEASLVHHATIAAWRFSREGRSWVGYGMNEAGNLLLQEVTKSDTLPGPELLRRVLAEKECDCMSAGFSRAVFRVVNRPASVIDWLGEPVPDSTRAALLAAALVAASDTAPRQGPRQWQILPPGAPGLERPTDVVLLWKVGDRARGVRGVYGMVVEAEQIARPLRGALGDAQFFPPSLVPEARAGALVRIEVAGPNRLPIFAAGPDTRAYTGTDTLGRTFGNLLVTAAIDPAAAGLLLAGGLPPSRAPTIVALLVLTLAMGGGALLLLRREHRLARLREDFVSGVSHELRTPLTQIRILSELLERSEFRTEEERARATGVIHREALRLSNLVDNILEFSRLRRPTGPGPAAAVPLGEVCREIAESFGPILDEKGQRLALSVEHEADVRGDRDAIGRVIRNLVENALKYGRPGQTIRVTLCGPDAAGAVQVTVDDEGPGIPAGERLRIWQPYYRLDRDRNAPAGGSGLGLSVVADLMRAMGGRAWVGDAPGGSGTRFIVEFAAAPARSVSAP